MFILRKITGEGNQVNICLNKSYTLVLAGQGESFDRAFENWGDNNPEHTIYGFIVYNDGASLFPLYKPSSYYIMTENGSTFANVSYK